MNPLLTKTTLLVLTLFTSQAYSQKTALIFGVTGQDGAYLAELLLEKGYEVHGVIRRSSSFNTQRINHLYKDPHDKNVHFFLHYGDQNDSSNVNTLVRNILPDEIYSLGAQSHVRVSFEIPEYTCNTVAMGPLRILEAIKSVQNQKKIKFYQASSSEMFGKVQETPQTEKTPFYPRSPYAVAKLFAYWMAINYRESYNIFACNGILFNHESPIRGETFVTRKITRAVAAIKHNIQDTLYLGNLDSKRDWGFAKDYVEVMWLMLQQEEPDDYVVATGKTYSVRKFVEMSFAHVGINIKWRGKGLDEVGYDETTNKVLVRIDKKYFRPAEVDLLLGDPSHAHKKLGWSPKTTVAELAKIMVESDLKEIESGKRKK